MGNDQWSTHAAQRTTPAKELSNEGWTTVFCDHFRTNSRPRLHTARHIDCLPTVRQQITGHLRGTPTTATYHNQFLVLGESVELIGYVLHRDVMSSGGMTGVPFIGLADVQQIGVRRHIGDGDFWDLARESRHITRVTRSYAPFVTSLLGLAMRYCSMVLALSAPNKFWAASSSG